MSGGIDARIFEGLPSPLHGAYIRYLSHNDHSFPEGSVLRFAAPGTKAAYKGMVDYLQSHEPQTLSFAITSCMTELERRMRILERGGPDLETEIAQVLEMDRQSSPSLLESEEDALEELRARIVERIDGIRLFQSTYDYRDAIPVLRVSELQTNLLQSGRITIVNPAQYSHLTFPDLPLYTIANAYRDQRIEEELRPVH